MYVVTNRNVVAGASGLDMLGDVPSQEGPNELRLLRIERTGRVRNRSWRVELLDDRLETAEVAAIDAEFELGLDRQQPYFASLRAAADLVRTARASNRPIVLFVHGFNNDVEAVLERAANLERNFKVQVVPFCWPANGGGSDRRVGVLDYKSDKRDARASAGALERTVAKIGAYLTLFNAGARERLLAEASARHPRDTEQRTALFARLMARHCPAEMNLMAHSMGNYVLKHMLAPRSSEGTRRVFGNVLLCAADTNNAGHASWLERIDCRGRVYVTINMRDYALSASMLKAGEEQLPRLGAHLAGLDAGNAVYVDFTGAEAVDDSHAYFEDRALTNPAVEGFFSRALTGARAEEGLEYSAPSNVWTLPRSVGSDGQ
ncbi:MAG: alpha/beta hydrolase [Ectothiorhodospiraceae bacterium]|nr:alpha/beta hydrolase [Ectothiorhodospiraceae bacterium]